MDGITITIGARYGHFTKPETNNSPLTYSFMHKVAFIGLIGALEGIERQEMDLKYPELCEDLLYSIKILNPIIKETHGFSKFFAVAEHFGKRGRRTSEILKDPLYEVTIGLKNERSRDIFDLLKKMIQERKRIYPLYMGNINCPLYIKNFKETDISEEIEGEFETQSVISSRHKINIGKDDSIDLSFEIVPTIEKNWNYTKKEEVIFTSSKLKVSGKYRKVGGFCQWFM